MAIGVGSVVAIRRALPNFRLLPAPPLWGVADDASGDVSVVWENGVQALITPDPVLDEIVIPPSGGASALALLNQIVDPIPGAAGVQYPNPGSRLRGVVVRVYDRIPADRDFGDSLNVCLVRTSAGLYYEAPLTDLSVVESR